MNRLILIIICTILISCEQNEIAIDKHPMGEIKTQQIEMGSDYSQQIYYNLATNSSIRNNLKTLMSLINVELNQDQISCVFL